MMIDFPQSPIIGQIFTAGSQQWMWDGAKWVANTQNLFALAMNDNRIINGDMRIDQRGVASGGGGTTQVSYTVDRWSYQSSQASRGTWRQGAASTVVPGFPYNLQFSSSSAYTSVATDYFGFVQAIEADMISDFAFGTINAQPITLSFLVYCNTLSGMFSGAIQNDNSGRAYPFTFNIPTLSTWTKIVITIPGDTGGTWVTSGNGRAMFVIFDLGSGANRRSTANSWQNGGFYGVTGAQSVVSTSPCTFAITGVKLEIGSVATLFNHLPLAQALSACQRYYQALLGYAYGSYCNTAAVTNSPSIVYPTSMRATPTATAPGITYTNCSALNLGSINAILVNPTVSVTAAGMYIWQSGATGILLNAEL